ncbi:hypothetical protein F4775DRAFT_607517 [Biscogniauxia sp. FL1348]|nr:hypothetical protein F4775DRAFT_607517 [Biscogniauxia sp. FL1348]
MASKSTVIRPAWECRDQTHQIEIYYNQPLRAKNRRLEDENLALKRLLRANGISWQAQINSPIQIQILSYSLTSPHTIVDPLCKLRRDCLTAQEKAEPHFLANHFLATCKAYYVEGSNALWSNNRFTFTTLEALKNFAELDYAHRKNIHYVTFRLIAQFYDDHRRVRRLPPSYHLGNRAMDPLKLNNLVGILREEGLLVEEAPVFLVRKNGICRLRYVKELLYKVIRAMREISEEFSIRTRDYKSPADVSLPAPPDEDNPCRMSTTRAAPSGRKSSNSQRELEEEEFRMWELFDRVIGKPWVEKYDDKYDKREFYETYFEDLEEEELCEKCGVEPLAPLNEEDIYAALSDWSDFDL